MVTSAQAVPVPTVDLLNSPAVWASDTVFVAQTKSFRGLTTGPLSGGFWPLETDATGRTQTQADQVAKGGARLAALLEALWPDAN
jgi:hypothetical protein